MDHRQYSRHTTDIATLLYQGGVPVATGRLRDASRGGVFCATDYPGLREHQRLQLECCIGSQRLWMHAHVLRREPAGAAFELDEGDPSTLHDIATLLALNAPLSNSTESVGSGLRDT